MSSGLYNHTQSLRFWSEQELTIRQTFTDRLVSVITTELLRHNPAWYITQCEGPTLIPTELISSQYTADDDIFVTQHAVGSGTLALRPETTPSSYIFAHNVAKHRKYPICVWQVGKSYRRETNDGATASKMRFNEFTQLEFQCIFSKSTKNDYREKIIPYVARLVAALTNCHTRVVPSDRVPSYADSTIDIECHDPKNVRWVEVASCSYRNDFSADTRVAEFAFGLDRLVDLHSEQIVRLDVDRYYDLRDK